MLARDNSFRKCIYLTKSAWYFRTQLEFRYQAKLYQKMQITCLYIFLLLRAHRDIELNPGPNKSKEKNLFVIGILIV